jgi:DNA-binding MarR family transcriptional regulator
MTDFRQSDAYQITWQVRRLFRAMATTANAYLEPLGITAADRAILEFLFPDGALTVPEIARRFNVSRQHVQVTVNGLLERGFVTQKENPAHKRSSLIVLTGAGNRLFLKIRIRDQRAIEDLFSDISVVDQRCTRKTLKKLLNTLDP